MPLIVDIDPGKRPNPKAVKPALVKRLAQKAGNPNASRARGAATFRLTVNQGGLQYEQRKNQGRREFRFQTGSLRLVLNQGIYVANDLSPCEQDIWSAHEQKHVDDIGDVMRRMEGRIRSHRDLQPIFISPQWFPIKEFDRTQDTISRTVLHIFRTMASEKTRQRDTAAEYDKINKDIDQKCPKK